MRGILKYLLILTLFILISTSIYALDSDGDGLNDTQESWVAEWYDCSNVKQQSSVTSNINIYDTDGDSLNDFEDRVWNLDPTTTDTDGDGSDEGNTIYSFIDECPKHCNDFCDVRRSSEWRDVVCQNSNSMLDDYLFKINHLSGIFNKGNTQIPTYWFGLYSNWKYDDTNTDFPDTWTQFSYDDSLWGEGNAYLGYEEFLISTNISYGGDPQNKYPTYYFRKKFNITKADVGDMEFNIDYDDGFVAYLNGVEFARSNGASDDHNTYVPYHESTIGDNPSAWYNHQFSNLNGFNDGENVIAIEVHNTQANSSDIVMGAYLVSYEDVTSDGKLDDLTDMCNILNSTSTNEEQLESELMALWLNIASANICYKENIFAGGCHQKCNEMPYTTVEELVNDVENTLINSQTSEYVDLNEDTSILNYGFCLDCQSTGNAPELTNITLLEFNKNTTNYYYATRLNWTDIPGTNYKLYYSVSKGALKNYNPGDPLPPVIKVITNIPDSNYTDWNASDDKKRYYKVSSECNGNEKISNNTMGKFRHEFFGNTTKSSTYYRSNWFALPFENSIPARQVIDNCEGGRALRIHKLDRINSSLYFFDSQEFDFAEPNYNLVLGKGYGIEVDTDCNYTVVGEVVEHSESLDLKGGDFGILNPYYRTNWVAANFYDDDVTASDLIETNADALRLYTIVRNTANDYSFQIYEKGIGPDFYLEEGFGYAIEVNNDNGVVIR